MSENNHDVFNPILSGLTNGRSANLSVSLDASHKPVPSHSLSPPSQMRKSNHKCQSPTALTNQFPQTQPSHIPKDPIQPRSGSISNVHSGTFMDDEESDFFSSDAPFRLRSHTCPENRMLQRRNRTRTRQRPLTPPPGEADVVEIDLQLLRLKLKEKLHIPMRELPFCIPENSVDKN